MSHPECGPFRGCPSRSLTLSLVIKVVLPGCGSACVDSAKLEVIGESTANDSERFWWEYVNPDRYVLVVESFACVRRPKHGNSRDAVFPKPGGRWRLRNAGNTSRHEQMKPTLTSTTLGFVRKTSLAVELILTTIFPQKTCST
jgi:hypothetical protein